MKNRSKPESFYGAFFAHLLSPQSPLTTHLPFSACLCAPEVWPSQLIYSLPYPLSPWEMSISPTPAHQKRLPSFHCTSSCHSVHFHCSTATRHQKLLSWDLTLETTVKLLVSSPLLIPSFTHTQRELLSLASLSQLKPFEYNIHFSSAQIHWQAITFTNSCS